MASMTPITHDSLRSRLHQGAVTFYFRKVNGELRRAFATTDLARIPRTGQPKGGTKPPGVTPFFDLEKNLWRSISQTQEVWLES